MGCATNARKREIRCTITNKGDWHFVIGGITSQAVASWAVTKAVGKQRSASNVGGAMREPTEQHRAGEAGAECEERFWATSEQAAVGITHVELAEFQKVKT